MKHFYYNFVRALAKLAVHMFYMPIEINGRDLIPKDSSHIIFAPNHQSAFLDAILVAVFSSKPIHFLTRADIFTFPFRYLLKSLNMMPVYRIRDGYKSLSKNEAVFNTCKDLVQAGKPILLFPEASQLLVHYLRPLSSGLSRIAYLTQEDFDKEVYIVPVGLNYFDHLNSGTKLIVNFAEAINLKEYFKSGKEKTEIINEIRKDTSSKLESVMFIPQNDDKYEERSRYLNRNYYNLGFDRLKQLINGKNQASVAPKYESLYILRLLLDIPNLLYFLIEFLIIKFLVHDKTFYASIKISLLMFLYPLYLILTFIYIFNCCGFIPAIIMLLIQLINYFLRSKLQSYIH